MMSSVVSARAIPGIETERVDIGHGWTLLTYQKREGGFSHCSVVATYVASSPRTRRLMGTRELDVFLVAHDGRLGFGLESYEWKITPGKRYNLDIYLDRHHYNTRAEGYSETKIQMAFKFDAQWLDRFGSAKALHIKIDGKFIGSYNLRGSRNASLELLNCVSRSLEAGAGQVTSPDEPSGLPAPSPEFLFSGSKVISLQQKSAELDINEAFSISEVAAKFSGYAVAVAPACEGDVCVIISKGDIPLVEIGLDHGLTKIWRITSIGPPEYFVDAQGNKIGDSLRHVLGAKSVCDAGMNVYCQSRVSPNLFYTHFVGDGNCSISVRSPLGSERVEIPSCAKIEEFHLMAFSEKPVDADN